MYNSSRGILYSAPPDEDGTRKLNAEESTEDVDAADEPAAEDLEPVAADAGDVSADD